MVLSIMAYSVVRIGREKLEQPAPYTALCPSAEAGMDSLPSAEALGQVAPWDASSIAVDHGIDEQTIVPWRSRQRDPRVPVECP